MDISEKEQQLATESRFRTFELFLNLAVDRVTGESKLIFRYDKSGSLVETERHSLMRNAQLASYDVLIELAKESPELRPIATSVLLRQICQSHDKNNFPEERALFQRLVALKWINSGANGSTADLCNVCKNLDTWPSAASNKP